MSIERWGSLSVADHNDVSALVANVLLYDRLLMPMYTESGDRNERAYWDMQQWRPDAQLERRQQLGGLVVECAWNQARRQAFTSRYEAAKQLDAEVNGEMVTRWLLADGQGYQMPPGVNHADVFVAYDSSQSTVKDIPLQKVNAQMLNEQSRIGVLLAHELGLPDIAEPEVALCAAIALSKETEFRNNRSDCCRRRKIDPGADEELLHPNVLQTHRPR